MIPLAYRSYGPLEKWFHTLTGPIRGPVTFANPGYNDRSAPRNLRLAAPLDRGALFRRTMRAPVLPLDYPKLDLPTLTPPRTYPAGAHLWLGTPNRASFYHYTEAGFPPGSAYFFYDPPGWPYWPPSHYRTWLGPNEASLFCIASGTPERHKIDRAFSNNPAVSLGPILGPWDHNNPGTSQYVTVIGDTNGGPLGELLLSENAAATDFCDPLNGTFLEVREDWGGQMRYVLGKQDYAPGLPEWSYVSIELAYCSAIPYDSAREPTGATGRWLHAGARDNATGEILLTPIPECSLSFPFDFMRGSDSYRDRFPLVVLHWPQSIIECKVTLPGGARSRIAYRTSTAYGIGTSTNQVVTSGYPSNIIRDHCFITGDRTFVASPYGWVMGSADPLPAGWTQILDQTVPAGPDLVVDLTTILQGLGITPAAKVIFYGGAKMATPAPPRYASSIYGVLRCGPAVAPKRMFKVGAPGFL